MIEYIALLREQFNDQVSLREKRPGIFQILLPIYREDGDMMAIFVEPIIKDAEEWLRISDHGDTLMFMFSFDSETPDNLRKIQLIAARNQIREDDGQLFMDVKPDGLFAGLLQFIQAVSQIMALEILAEGESYG